MVAPADIEKKLTDKLSEVTHVTITDESSGCGENYSLVLVSPDFEGKSTLARHRLVNEILKDEIAQMHAFTQKSLTPKQWEAQKDQK